MIDVQERPDSNEGKAYPYFIPGRTRADQNIKRSKKQAKRTADSLLDVVKKHPEQFEAFARKMSNDPTAKEKAGDLGWFADGAMIYAFNQACLIK